MFYGNICQEDYINENTQLEMPLDEIYYNMVLSENYIEDFEALNEGANIEITKKCREFYKKYKENIKAAKAAIKDGDKKTAKSNIKQAKGELEKFKKEVENMDSTAGSAIFGFFAHILVQFAKDAAFIFGNFGLSLGSNAALHSTLNVDMFTGLITSSNPLVTILGSIGLRVSIVAGFIYNMYNVVVDIIKIINSIDNGDSAADSLNLYRVEMLKVCDKFDKNISKLEKSL